MLEADSGVVALANGAEIIGVGLDGGKIFVINVLSALITEGALLSSRITALLLGFFGHNGN